MENIKFAHISPVCYMEKAEMFSGCNLVLAHLADVNDKYANFYAKSKKYTIMDNGAFELGESYDPSKLIELGHKVNAQCIVLPDYPNQEWQKTVDAAILHTPAIKAAGFDVMFVPQALKGDVEGYMKAWRWALFSSNIDLVGLSILGAPNAYPEENRLITRYKILRELETNCHLKSFKKKIHMLGMLDTVHEIALCKQFEYAIKSWDSSAAVWAGLNDKRVSQLKSKFETPVDFDFPLQHEGTIRENIFYVQGLLS